MSAILPVHDDGLVYFFSMATSFTKAALGAEGIGKDVTMIIGRLHSRTTLRSPWMFCARIPSRASCSTRSIANSTNTGMQGAFAPLPSAYSRITITIQN